MLFWRDAFAVTGLCFLLVAALPARAEDTTADRANIEAFLNITGFDVALEAIAHSADHAPALLGQEVEDFGPAWVQISEDVFDTAEMHNMAVDILAKTLSAGHLGHAAEFYASDLGQRLVAVENASHANADSDEKRGEGLRLIKEMGASSPRMTSLLRLMEAVDTSQQSVRAVQEVMVRFLIAASHTGALGYAIDEETLRQLIRADEAAMTADMEEGGRANAAFTYRDISDEDLEAYAETLEDPIMQEVYQLMNAVQYEIMANRFEALAVAMADLSPAEEL
ncbi:MAG: DUF2059 domain-containing protein [Pseudomonadota bacterium]